MIGMSLPTSLIPLIPGRDDSLALIYPNGHPPPPAIWAVPVNKVLPKTGIAERQDEDHPLESLNVIGQQYSP